MSFTSRIAAAAARGYGMFRIAAAAAVDPFFNYVTALLHGDGTNGAQNNTFLDSSTNNFTITRNGNTTQGTFSPFSQTGWSNYFDGSSAYLSMADNSGFDIGLTGQSFTLELFIWPTTSGNYMTFGRGGGFAGWNSTTGWQYLININSNTLYWQYWSGTALVATSGSLLSSTWALNQWNHIAVSYNGTTTGVFVNGTRIITSSTGYGKPSSSTITYISRSVVSAETYYVPGYLSNIRIVKGTAVYDPTQTTLTVPTSPLTAISGTSFLTCQGNRFVDASSNNIAVSVGGGSPSVQAFSPFNPTSAWSASSNGGSGYFDGSGDYLSAANNTAFDMGSGDFTIEGWVYQTAAGTNPTICGKYEAGFQASWAIGLTSSNWDVYTYYGATSVLTVYTGARPALNQWVHFALERNGANIEFYVNGSRLAQVGAQTMRTSISAVAIGALGAGYISGYEFPGYISGLRIVKGTAVYSGATYTVPTVPATAITNTQLLLSCTNAGIYDNAAVGNYETVGNAQVSTAVVKYGTGSMYFDGVGDYLVAPSRQTTSLTGDFTIEFWAYRNSGAFRGFTIGDDSGASGLSVYYSSGSAVWIVYNTNATRISGGSATVSIWQHIAVVRCAGIVKLYVNGTQVGSTWSSTATFSGALYIAAEYNAGTAYADTNGYIDDFRLTNGVCRYPYNFTPPTAAFPNIGGTVTLTADPYFNYTTLLLPGNGTNGAQNNTFLDSSSNAFTITRNGNTTQGNFSPFSQTGWGNYFNGSSYLSTPNVVALSGNFTIETWVYYPGATSNGLYVGAINSSGYGYWCFYYNNSVNALRVVGTASATYIQSPSFTFPVNQWVHVAVTRSGTTVNWWVNGTSIGTTTDSTNWTGSAASTFVGSIDGTNQNVTAYLSNMRVVVGTAVYTSNFTPSIAPLAAVSGTWLLTCQSNRFVDNSSNAYALTSTGTSVQAFSPFAPTAAYSASTVGGSGYFDGSGDYLTVPDNAAFTMGTGDFSVECWYYPTASVRQSIVAQTNAAGNTLSFWMEKNASNQLRLVANVGGTDYVATATATMPLNSWSFLQMVRSGTTIYGYQNGTQVCSVAVGSGALLDSTDVVSIGGGTVSLPVTGYIADVRILKGTASSATTPTAPLTAIANTQLLLSYTNGGITDATAKNNLETVGNAQISTTQSKFGGSSMLFDGTGDWLLTRTSPNLDMGSGDMTVEGWFYLTATVAVDYRMIVSDATNGNNYICIRSGGTGGQLEVNVNATSFRLNLNNSVTINTWFHLAVTRYNGTWYGFINGVSLGTSTQAGTFNLGNGGMYVGRFGGATAYEWPGYIDDLRITKGIARYTSNFTPPTSAFLTL